MSNQINSREDSFKVFKEAIETAPVRTLFVINNYGDRKKLVYSEYITECNKNFTTNIGKSLMRIFVGSSLAVFGLTFILHRQRHWALTSTGLFRSICFKYLPVWAIYGYIDSQCFKKVKVD